VVEKPAGMLQLGAGFSTVEKLSLSFGITNENFLGSGNYLGLQVDTSKYNRTISLTSMDPYFTKDGISRTFDIYHRTMRPYYAQDGDYRLVSQGGSVRFGVPFSEVDTVYFGVGAERYQFNPGSNSATTPQAYLDYFHCPKDSNQVVGPCANDNVWGIPLTVGWMRDSRDSALVPTSGRLQRANLEVGAGGDMRYYRGGYQYQQYVPLTKKYTLALNAEVGYGKPIGNKTYPIFKNYYAGGLGSVRGFEQNSLGPRDAVTQGALGGTKKAVLNMEFTSPFPGAGNDRTLRWYTFFDIGNVFSDRPRDVSDAQWSAQKMWRASAGLGISWISPIGPLRLAYAVPVRSQKEKADPANPTNTIPADRIQRVQFQIGTSF